MRFWLVLFLFYAINTQAVPSAAPADLGLGQPGCAKVILGRVIDQKSEKALTPECRSFRNAYVWSIENYAYHPKTFTTTLQQKILAAKKPKPPYHALLMAVLAHEQKLIPAIQARSQLENKLKVQWKYGVAALSRLKTGRCEKSMLAVEEYRELCLTEDRVMGRLQALRKASK